MGRVVSQVAAAIITPKIKKPPGALVIDLASSPGGTDFAAAKELGIRAEHALSLPARCAPQTAGELVADTVQTILQEREDQP